MVNRLLIHLNSGTRLVRKQDPYRELVSNVLNRCLSQCPKTDRDESSTNDSSKGEKTTRPPLRTMLNGDPQLVNGGSQNVDLFSGRWKRELSWLSEALASALQFYKWASPKGNDGSPEKPTSSRSLTEVLSHLQSNKIIQDWSLSDLTVGLYLIYLSQASDDKVENFKGVQISSDVIVQELIYHIELAKGAYKDNSTGLARHSMLREGNIVKFVKDSSVMRPGYYIGVDTRNKLVVFGIRGTHTVYDFITDVVSSSDQKVSFEGFSSHFGTAEAARWYLRHELGTIRKCMDQHKGFRLRLVGHSLGGASAALLAIMLRKKTVKELGFNPDVITAVGFGTPPCVSKELAESCGSYVSTVVLQDDIIPRLSVASLARLRTEILETDWMSILEKEDWKSVKDLVTNAKQVVSSVQDVARKLSDYTNFSKAENSSGNSVGKELASWTTLKDAQPILKHDVPSPEELYVPGAVYYLKRETDVKGTESYTLWKRQSGQHFRRILLSGNLISDHRCDSTYYALRDVLKSLPVSEVFSNGDSVH